MNEERMKLIEALNITLQDSDREIAEKMFCAALTTIGTDNVETVLKSYNNMRAIMRGKGAGK